MRYLKGVTTLQLNPEKCTGCRRCVEVCPREVFAIHDGIASIQDRDLCMECGACEKNCDAQAIQVKAGVGCAAALIFSLRTGKAPSCDCGSSGSCC